MFLKSGINLHCFGCFVIPCGVLGDTEEKRTTDRQRQTRAVTTIDRDTGEGRTEPRGGVDTLPCCPCVMLKDHLYPLATVEKHWNSSSYRLPTHIKCAVGQLDVHLACRTPTINASELRLILFLQWPPWQPRSIGTCWVVVKLNSINNQCCLCNELTQNHAHTDILYGPYIFMHGCVNVGKIKFVGSHGGHERSHSTHICVTGHKGAQVNTVT